MHTIGLAGPAGVGKDTVADRLVEVYGFHKYSMSDPLKAALCGLLGEGLEAYEDRELKEEAHGMFPHITRRELMQSLGTGFVRKVLGKDAFLKLASRTIEQHDRTVNSSIRFENEAEWIRSQENGHIIHIVRPENPYKIDSNHISEKVLEVDDRDFIVYNTMNLDYLYKQLALIIRRIGA